MASNGTEKHSTHADLPDAILAPDDGGNRGTGDRGPGIRTTSGMPKHLRTRAELL
jgi:hypothetical protein